MIQRSVNNDRSEAYHRSSVDLHDLTARQFLDLDNVADGEAIVLGNVEPGIPRLGWSRKDGLNLVWRASRGLRSRVLGGGRPGALGANLDGKGSPLALVYHVDKVGFIHSISAAVDILRIYEEADQGFPFPGSRVLVGDLPP